MRVLIDRSLFVRLLAYSRLCKTEVGGMGMIIMNDDGDIEVKNVYLSKQQAHSTTCELDATDLGRLEYEARNEQGELALWWHSHVDMAASPSGQDNETMKRMAGNGRCLMLIINRRGETYAEYSYNGDKDKLIPAGSVKCEIDVIDAIDTAAIKKELDEYVLPFTPQQPEMSTGYDGSLFGTHFDGGYKSYGKKTKPRAEKLEQWSSRKVNDGKRMHLSAYAFNFYESHNSIRLASGYLFAISKYHKDTVYIAEKVNNFMYSVPYNYYVALTMDNRASVEQLVKA